MNMRDVNSIDIPSTRIINFEILRNVAMLFIVIYHILYHGVQLKETIIVPNIISIPNFVVSQYLLTICSTCVNLYVLITGYFLFEKSFKSIRFIKVWFLAFFYGIIITGVMYHYYPDTVSLVNVLQNVRPMTLGPYWFVKQYLGLLIAAPLLGYVAKTIDQTQFKILLLVLFVLGTNFTDQFGSLPFGEALIFNRGFSLIWFICLFFTGAYIRRFDLRFSSFKFFFILSLLVCLYTIIRIIVSYFFLGADLKFINFDYNGFPYILAISFFSWIKHCRFRENLITRILVRTAPYTFAVYLIHDNKFFRSVLYGIGGINPGLLDSPYMIPHILVFSFFVFFVCIMIDVIRSWAFRVLGIDKIQTKVALIIDDWINRFSARLN